jgi:hypothetical protein
MRSNNRNEAITHLAMPERQIPVLIDSSTEKAEGFVPSATWSGKPLTSVRRLLPSFVDGLQSPRRRKEIEKEHGAIDAEEWNRLRELLTLIDRLNAGNWSPLISIYGKDALKPIAAQLDRTSPGGWSIEERKTDSGKLAFRLSSGDGQSVDFGVENITLIPIEQMQTHKAETSHFDLTTTGDGKIVGGQMEIRGEVKEAAFAFSEAFTAGLSKTRFVVWWHDAAKRLVPGLYCPDIVTALYALAMWSSGTAGGWAICQKCGNDYPRSRAKQRYCSHKCQVAAAMQRMRDKAKRTAQKETKPEPKTKKRTGRK